MLFSFFPQVFQSQITALQDEMEEKGQEMDKLRQELKDKEVENRIAGKKGDQLVSICLFVCCAFAFVLVVISFCFVFFCFVLVFISHVLGRGGWFINSSLMYQVTSYPSLCNLSPKLWKNAKHSSQDCCSCNVLLLSSGGTGRDGWTRCAVKAATSSRPGRMKHADISYVTIYHLYLNCHCRLKISSVNSNWKGKDPNSYSKNYKKLWLRAESNLVRSFSFSFFSFIFFFLVLLFKIDRHPIFFTHHPYTIKNKGTENEGHHD